MRNNRDLDTTPWLCAQIRVLHGLRTLSALGLLVLAVASCGNETSPRHGGDEAGHEEHAAETAEKEGSDHEDHEDRGDEIRIGSEVQKRFGIATEPVGPGPVEVICDLPGEIVSDPDRMVHVRPPFAGTVQRVFKHLGDRVDVGDKLAVLESIQALAPYTLTAGIPGVITAEHAAVGESVDVGHELFTIADTAVVWVQLQVFPADLSRVHVGDPVEVLAPGAMSGVRGEISFVSPIVDPATRTATALVVIDNEEGYLPGLFVTGRVAVEREQSALSIPTSALVRDEYGWVVFVRGGQEQFERRPVSVGRRGIERSAIQEGIEAGEEVVADGAFLVKSAAARSEMGGGHSH